MNTRTRPPAFGSSDPVPAWVYVAVVLAFVVAAAAFFYVLLDSAA